MKSRQESQYMRDVAGALRSCIDAHGPITKDRIGSASKRIVKQLKANAKQDETDRKVYLNHIRRLEYEKRVLTTLLVVERRSRIEAWAYYRKRLTSKFFALFDLILIGWQGRNR